MSRQVKKVSISGKEDKSNKVTSWSNTTTDTHYPSEKLVKDSLDNKEASSNKVSSWSSTTTDTNYPSEKLVKDSLDGKLDKLQTANKGKNVVVDSTSGEITFENKPTIPTKISDLTNDSDFIETSSTTGLIKNDGTIDTTSYSTQNVWYGTCSSLGSAQVKEVDVSNWSFNTGNLLFVKFSYANSYDGTSKLEIENVSKDVVTVGTTKISRYHWRSGELVGFVYDGTNFTMLEEGIASTTYYGVTKLENSVSSTSTTTSATPNSVKTAYDLANSKPSLDDIYPIGSIYMSVNSTNPSTLFGGTWEQIKDSFLLACGDTYSNGATGGEATHTLTVDEMPSHKHTAGRYDDNYELGNEGFASGSKTGVYVNTSSSNSSTRIHTNYTGSGQAHNNMPPYLAVYMWKRTA